MIDPSWKIATEQVHDGEKFRAPASQQGNVPVNDANRIFATADYYARREAQERVLSERATDPTARIAHAELASRYAKLCRVPEPA